MTSIQMILDDIIRKGHFKSVSDLEYYEPDNVVIVKRKMGTKSTVVDVSNDMDEESLRNHLASIPAIY